MTAYVKALSKRSEGDDKEKTLPVAHLGSSMVSHGEDFDGNSEYGQCLTSTLQSHLKIMVHLSNLYASVWKNRGAHCACSRGLYRTSDFKLA